MTAGRATSRTERADVTVTERDEFFFELRELAALVRRRKVWIVAAMAVCAGLALLAIAFHQPVYTSTAQVMLDPRGLNVVGDQVIPQSPSSDVNDAVIDTETRLLTSDSVLEAVVESCGLADDPGFVGRPGLASRLAGDLGLRGSSERGGEALVAMAVSELRKRLTIQRDGKSFIVNITVRADEPGKAAKIAKATVTAFFQELVTQKREVVSQAQGAMGSTLEGQRNRLAEAETAVERYKASAGILDSDGHLLNTARVTELNSQRMVAHNTTAALAARLEQLETLKRSPSQPQPFDSPLLTQLRTNRAEAARQQANLLATLGPRHPQVREVDAQVQSLNRAVLQEVERLYATAKSDYAAAAARERALDQDRQKLEGQINTTNAALVGLRELEREAEAQRSVYEKFMGRERELREQETISAVNATVLADPTPSPIPVGLKPSLLLAASLILGALLGTAGAWIFERMTGRVYSAGRLGAGTRLEVLGPLPMAIPAGSNRAVVACALARGRGTATSRAIYRVADGLDRGGDRVARSLLVLSVSAGAAGTIVASSVVLAEARLGRSTLLVETAANDDAFHILSRAGLEVGGVATCSVEGFPSFSVARLAESVSPAVRDNLRQAWCSTFERIVVCVGADTDETTVRGLADGTDAIVVVVQDGVSRFSELNDLRELLGDNQSKVFGTLFVARGADAIAELPRRTALFQPQVAGARAVRALSG